MHQVILLPHTSPQTSGTLKWGTAGAHMSILTLESADIHKLIYTFDLPTILGPQLPPLESLQENQSFTSFFLLAY